MIWACVLGPRFDGQLSHGLPTLALCPLPKLRRHWPESQSLRNRSLRVGRLQRVASFFGARPFDGSKTTFDGCLKYYLTNFIYFVLKLKYLFFFIQIGIISKMFPWMKTFLEPCRYP